MSGSAVPIREDGHGPESEPGPRDVLTSLPSPAPGTVRRTVSLEVTPGPTWDRGLVVAATARDLLVGPDGIGRVLDARELTVTLDATSQITGVSGDLPTPVMDGLAGMSAAGGFRARLATLVEAGLQPYSLESALLDDLPTVRLISGYAVMMEMAGEFPHSAGPSPMVGVCAGWAPGASADRRVRSGIPLLTPLPPAPALASMTTEAGEFHAEPAARAGSMRRRRILDVVRHGDALAIFQYFRDSHLDPALREGALHEYVVRATASAVDGLPLTAIDVEPRVLPFPECPLASRHVPDLLGTSLHEITGTVRARLPGTRGCTHLNDVLRFLRYVPALSSLASAG
ncbi:MAG: hypothetical protein JWO67_6255 [Streptosporangiaceae bacterium]|nr:hypothetical protein [Streptosporangiaceae bacterium]